MMLLLFRFLYWLKGWELDLNLPEGAHHSVLLAAPHTSNWDFVYALVALKKLGLNVKFTIKKEFNVFPLGPMIQSLGALWIDRSPRKGSTKRRSYIDVMTDIMKQEGGEKMAVVITPEGTRSKTENWKTGFYYVALNAGVPITLGYMDYANKKIGIGDCIVPTGNMEADLKRIMDFYEGIPGKFPENFSVDVRYR